MKRQYILIAILALILLLWYLYAQLGGSAAIEIETVKREFILQGIPYEGRYDSPDVRKLFEKARNVSDSTGFPLAVVNYGSDEDAKNIEQFIGILTDRDVMVTDSSFLLRRFEPPLAVMAKIEAHNVVMPRPEEVREQALNYAASNELILGRTTIEVYRSERSLEVYFLPN